jgi:DNA mismatch repair protein MutS2
MLYEALDLSLLRQALASFCKTLQGERLCWTEKLAENLVEARARYLLLEEALLLQEQEAVLPLGAIFDFRAALKQLDEGARLAFDQIYELYQSLLAIELLKQLLVAEEELVPHLFQLVASFSIDGGLMSLLQRSFDERGELSEQCYPKLAKYGQQKRESERSIQQELKRLLSDADVGRMLQESLHTVRNGRHVLPLKAHFKRGFGIVHARSQSGETVFVEPLSILRLSNRAKEAELALEAERRRIQLLLCQAIQREAHCLLEGLQLTAQLDLVLAKGLLSRRLRAEVPEVGAEGKVSVKGFRHPVLELQGAVVDNDLFLSAAQPAVLLTGPNAGGKTVSLKSFGLLAVMARLGMGIPAQANPRVDFFDPIVIDLGDNQQLEAGLSTFGAQLLSLRGALEQGREGSLVLLDEPGMGTDPTQGSALAQSILEELIGAGARVVSTTHFVRLKALSEIDRRFRTAAAQFEHGRPTYRLRWDEVGASHALALAQQLELPELVIDRARQLIDERDLQLSSLLEELERERDQQDQKRSELEEAHRVLQERTLKAERLQQRLEEKLARQEDRALQQFQHRLEKLEAEAKGWVAELQRNPSSQLAGKTLAEIRALKEVEEELSESEEEAVESVEVGARIRHDAWGEGEVISVSGRRAEVQFSRLRVQVELSELSAVLPQKRSAPARQQASRRQGPRQQAQRSRQVPSEQVAVRGSSNTCDLRGARVDEALSTVEVFLDSHALSGVPVVFILHGHGTGALKRAIRAWLPSSSYVKSWRPADAHEGGDAYTVVVL